MVLPRRPRPPCRPARPPLRYHDAAASESRGTLTPSFRQKPYRHVPLAAPDSAASGRGCKHDSNPERRRSIWPFLPLPTDCLLLRIADSTRKRQTNPLIRLGQIEGIHPTCIAPRHGLTQPPPQAAVPRDQEFGKSYIPPLPHYTSNGQSIARLRFDSCHARSSASQPYWDSVTE